VFGVPFERAQAFHRWLGYASVLLAALHGSSMALWYAAASPLGLRHVLFTWTDATGVNPAAGALAGACIVTMALLARERVRRAAYRLFLLGHTLFPLVFWLAYVHTRHSKTPAWPLFEPGLWLVAADFALCAVDVLLRPTRIVSAHAIGSCSGDALPHTVAIKLQKAPLLLSSWFGFKPRPSQFVYVAFAGAVKTILPHPYSVVPDDSNSYGDQGTFTVYIKDMGPGTWSRRVVTAVHDVMARNQTPLSPGLSPVAAGSASRETLRQLQRALGRPLVTGAFGRIALPLHQYNDVILVAGGIGVTAIAPLHTMLCDRHSKAADYDPLATTPLGRVMQTAFGRNRVEAVHTVWSTRDPALLREFGPRLRADATAHAQVSPPRGDTAQDDAADEADEAETAPALAAGASSGLIVKVSLHLTAEEMPTPRETMASQSALNEASPSSTTNRLGSASRGNSDSSLTSCGPVTYARPDLKQVLRQVTSMAISTRTAVGTAAVAVVCCGPASMTDA
jgi:hypothetical protein